MPVVLDASVRRYDGGRVLVGRDGRIVRLTAAGARVVADPPPALARRLVDAGLAHPVPGPVEHADATIVVPVKDRAQELDRCLTGPALVVDDGSRDPQAIAQVCARHGATVLRRDVCAGPAAARNHALAHVTTGLVAFLDSDCAPPPGWIERLAGHFADPRVAAVAPRVDDPALDMGARPAAVKPGTRVSYVPSAALIVRREAIGGGFDPALRYGEDVDLIWRLHDRGWTIRYDPRVVIAHGEAGRSRARAQRRSRAQDALRRKASLAGRRFAYGTSAAPLSRRHPTRLAPFTLAPGPTAILALLAMRRPRLAAAVYAVQTARLARTLHAHRVPARLAPRWIADATVQTARGVITRHPAYAAGVIAGAVRHRTLRPLIPQRPRKDAFPGPRSRNDRTAHDVSSVANSSPTASGTIESAPRIPELT
jgi:mycofactocin system glycosyltransferase